MLFYSESFSDVDCWKNKITNEQSTMWDNGKDIKFSHVRQWSFINLLLCFLEEKSVSEKLNYRWAYIACRTIVYRYCKFGKRTKTFLLLRNAKTAIYAASCKANAIFARNVIFLIRLLARAAYKNFCNFTYTKMTVFFLIWMLWYGI